MNPGLFFTRIESLIACTWSRVQRNLHAHEPSGTQRDDEERSLSPGEMNTLFLEWFLA